MIQSGKNLAVSGFKIRNIKNKYANELRNRNIRQVVMDGGGNDVIAEAITDRLENPSEVIELKGVSYRKKLGES